MSTTRRLAATTSGLAPTRRSGAVRRSPLIGVDLKGLGHGQSDAIDPDRTLALAVASPSML